MWAGFSPDMLWRYAMAVVPLALFVALVTRFVPCRPPTRHALWLIVLLWLILAPMLPASPSVELSFFQPGVADATPSDEAKPQDNIFNGGWRPQSTGVRRSRTSRRPVARVAETGRSRVSERRDSPPPRPKLAAPTSLAQVPSPGGPPALFSPPRLGLDARPLEYESLADTMPAPRTDLRLTPRYSSPPMNGYGGGSASFAGKPATAAIPEKTEALTDQPNRMQEWIGSVLSVRDAIGQVPSIPPSIWFGGAGLLALIATLRLLRFGRQVSTAVPAPRDVRRMVRKVAKRLGVRSAPETLMLDRKMSPMIWCGRRLRLILPTGLWSELDETGQRAVIAHELAHLRRGDHWVSRLEMLAGTIYWWHPLVWWVRSRIHAEAEFCCDAWVTSLMPQQRRAYAEALLKTKQSVREESSWVPTLGIGMATGRAGRFARRITMVMTESVRPRLSGSGIALALIVATAGWFATPAKSCPPKTDLADVGGIVSTKVVATSDCNKPPRPTRPRGIWRDAGSCACGSAKCSDCDTGSGCGKGCGKAKDCVGSSHQHAQRTYRRGRAAYRNGLTTYERHLASRYADAASALPAAPAMATAPAYVVGTEPAVPMASHYYATASAPMVTSYVPGMVGTLYAGFGDDDDVEARLARLEKKLQRLAEHLDRANDGPKCKKQKKQKKQGKGRRKVREARHSEALGHFHDALPDPPEAPRRARAPRGPRAPRAPRAPRGPLPPHAKHPDRADHDTDIGFFGGDNDSDKTVARMYKISDGKRQALTELMVRSDVPVLVGPTEDGLEVDATPRNHKIFRAFLRMIDPNDDGRSSLDDDDAHEAWAEATEYFAQEKAAQAAQSAEFRSQAQGHEFEAQAHQAEAMVRAAELHEHALQISAEHMANFESARARFKAQSSAMAAQRMALDAERAALEEQERTIQEAVEQVREEADALRESEEKVRDEADKLRERAEELQDKAADLEADADGEELEKAVQLTRAMADEVRGVEESARDMDRKASNVEREYQALERQAEQLEQDAEGIEQKMERIEQKAEQLEDKSRELEEKAEELQEQAEERAEAQKQAQREREHDDDDHDDL